MAKRKIRKWHNRTQRLWTDQEIRRLKSLAKREMSAVGVARRLRRPLHSTKKKASRLGIALGIGRRRWTTAEIRKLKALADGRRPLPAIARLLKRSMFAVERIASVHRISLDFRA
jgi:hypothetical protein